MVVDAETPFADTGQPYLAALDGAGLFTADPAVEVVTLPDYGRDGGTIVRGARAAVADSREALVAFFDALPPKWQLPPSHGIRIGPGVWGPEGSAERWGAHVVRTDSALGLADVARVDLESRGIAVRLTASGANRFEELTAANVGQRVAIVVDDELRADPVINEPIPGGTVMISLGDGRGAEKALADRMRAAIDG